jgi:hypothetical protein
MKTRTYLLGLAAALAVAACAGADKPAASGTAANDSLAPLIDHAALQARLDQFAPADIGFDRANLSAWENQVVDTLIAASKIINDIYLLQVSEKNPEWRAKLASGDQVALQYFDLMAGPWDRLRSDSAFLNVGPKPPGAGFYPVDMTKEQFESWIAAHPKDKDAFTGYFTVIRRQDSALVAVPYSKAYAAQLNRAATLLRSAATISQNKSLSDFLNKRADAFLNDDYYASDVAWMDITGTRVEPTIGPYEVYEDAMFGYKAYFESYITVEDPAASAELNNLKARLPKLEMTLPIDDKFKNPNRKFESPIRVVDEAYTGGSAGVQTTAFNLPNDVRVTEAKGSKKVMLRNVAHAKFDKILSPIAQTVLDPALASQIEFKPWFTNVVMHELAHGLGPTTVTTPSGERTSVNKALKDKYSALEEAKADVTGLHNLTMLANEGVYDSVFVQKAFIGHMADIFRAVRFGTTDAHGRANLIQFNYLREKNALRYDPKTGLFSGDVSEVIAANRELSHDILTLEARGDYAAAVAFVDKYAKDSAELTAAIAKLGKVPVDIRARYTAAVGK